MKEKISLEEKERIIASYKSGESSVTLGKRLGVSPSTVIGYLKNWGVRRRSKIENGQKYAFDETFFDLIDSEEKAYFLGFLYADGYNGEKQMKYRVCLSLNIKDEEILHKLRERLQSSHPIYFDKRNCCTLAIHNKHLSERLVELGCHRAKTFTVVFPEWLRKDLIPHFIRGYNDGDGHIHFNGKGVTVGSLGATAFIYRLAEEIKDSCGVHISFSPHPKSKGITLWQVRGRDQVSTVLAWLYKDATVYLERKKRKAEAVLTPVYYQTKPNGSDCHLSTLTELQVIEIKSLLASKLSLGEIGKRFEVGKGVIGDISSGRTWHHLTNFNTNDNLARGQAKGESHPMVKLTKNEVLEIKDLINKGWSNIDLADRFLISKDTISKIRCGKVWGHVTGIEFKNQGKAHLGENNTISKLTNANVLEIKQLLERGETGVYIARKFGITKSCVSAIKNGASWAHITGFSPIR